MIGITPASSSVRDFEQSLDQVLHHTQENLHKLQAQRPSRSSTSSNTAAVNAQVDAARMNSWIPMSTAGTTNQNIRPSSVSRSTSRVPSLDLDFGHGGAAHASAPGLSASMAGFGESSNPPPQSANNNSSTTSGNDRKYDQMLKKMKLLEDRMKRVEKENITLQQGLDQLAGQQSHTQDQTKQDKKHFNQFKEQLQSIKQRVDVICHQDEAKQRLQQQLANNPMLAFQQQVLDHPDWVQNIILQKVQAEVQKAMEDYQHHHPHPAPQQQRAEDDVGQESDDFKPHTAQHHHVSFAPTTSSASMPSAPISTPHATTSTASSHRQAEQMTSLEKEVLQLHAEFERMKSKQSYLDRIYTEMKTHVSQKEINFEEQSKKLLSHYRIEFDQLLRSTTKTINEYNQMAKKFDENMFDCKDLLEQQIEKTATALADFDDRIHQHDDAFDQVNNTLVMLKTKQMQTEPRVHDLEMQIPLCLEELEQVAHVKDQLHEAQQRIDNVKIQSHALELDLRDVRDAQERFNTPMQMLTKSLEALDQSLRMKVESVRLDMNDGFERCDKSIGIVRDSQKKLKTRVKDMQEDMSSLSSLKGSMDILLEDLQDKIHEESSKAYDYLTQLQRYEQHVEEIHHQVQDLQGQIQKQHEQQIALQSQVLQQQDMQQQCLDEPSHWQEAFQSFQEEQVNYRKDILTHMIQEIQNQFQRQETAFVNLKTFADEQWSTVHSNRAEDREALAKVEEKLDVNLQAIAEKLAEEHHRSQDHLLQHQEVVKQHVEGVMEAVLDLQDRVIKVEEFLSTAEKAVDTSDLMLPVSLAHESPIRKSHSTSSSDASSTKSSSSRGSESSEAHVVQSVAVESEQEHRPIYRAESFSEFHQLMDRVQSEINVLDAHFKNSSSGSSSEPSEVIEPTLAISSSSETVASSHPTLNPAVELPSQRPFNFAAGPTVVNTTSPSRILDREPQRNSSFSASITAQQPPFGTSSTNNVGVKRTLSPVSLDMPKMSRPVASSAGRSPTHLYQSSSSYEDRDDYNRDHQKVAKKLYHDESNLRRSVSPNVMSQPAARPTEPASSGRSSTEFKGRASNSSQPSSGGRRPDARSVERQPKPRYYSSSDEDSLHAVVDSKPSSSPSHRSARKFELEYTSQDSSDRDVHTHREREPIRPVSSYERSPAKQRKSNRDHPGIASSFDVEPSRETHKDKRGQRQQLPPAASSSSRRRYDDNEDDDEEGYDHRKRTPASKQQVPSNRSSPISEYDNVPRLLNNQSRHDTSHHVADGTVMMSMIQPDDDIYSDHDPDLLYKLASVVYPSQDMTFEPEVTDDQLEDNEDDEEDEEEAPQRKPSAPARRSQYPPLAPQSMITTPSAKEIREQREEAERQAIRERELTISEKKRNHRLRFQALLQEQQALSSSPR